MALPVIYNLFTKEINSESNNVAVVVFTCKPKREPIVYDVTGIEDVDAAVENSVKSITAGCNYTYSLVRRVANVYFYE